MLHTITHKPNHDLKRGNMLKKYFPKVEKTNPYEGRDSKNPLAFQFYNKNQKISTKKMAIMIILNQNGLGSGGLIFDAKVRRNSSDMTDLLLIHIYKDKFMFFYNISFL